MDVHAFDRVALLEALEPPRFRNGEQEYVGKLLSALEWFRFEESIRKAGGLEGPAVTSLVHELTDMIFPPPPRWQFWRKSVGDLVEALPFGLQVEVFQSFVAAQATAQYRTTPGRTPTKEKTSGTDSVA